MALQEFLCGYGLKTTKEMVSQLHLLFQSKMDPHMDYSNQINPDTLNKMIIKKKKNRIALC